MNEQNNIPPEALFIEIMRCNITAYQAIVSDQKETIAQLNARIAELERELAKVREVAHENFDYLEQQLSPEGRE